MTEENPKLLILDSWPIMEGLKGHQTVRKQVAALYEDAKQGVVSFAISRINLGEVIYLGRKELKLPDDKLEDVLQALRNLPIEVVSATDGRVDAAVDLKSIYNISYADAFAAALSIERDAPLVTGDRELKKLEAAGLLQLHWLGA